MGGIVGLDIGRTRYSGNNFGNRFGSRVDKYYL